MGQWDLPVSIVIKTFQWTNLQFQFCHKERNCRIEKFISYQKTQQFKQ